MATTLYARSDVGTFFNPDCPTGGHARKLKNARAVARGEEPEYDDERLIVNCDACEPALRQFVMNVKDREGKVRALKTWSDNPHVLPLTEGEEEAATRAEKAGLEAMVATQSALYSQFQKAIASGAIKLDA